MAPNYKLFLRKQIMFTQHHDHLKSTGFIPVFKYMKTVSHGDTEPQRIKDGELERKRERSRFASALIRLSFSFALCLCVSVAIHSHQDRAFAQHGQHSSNIEPAKLMTGLSDLHHPVSTKNQEAQKFFDQGLALIYAFNH